MREVRKVIKRKSQRSAERAMIRHITEMDFKGWRLSREFAGYSHLYYECIAYFTKGE